MEGDEENVKLYGHLVVKCMEAVETVVETACENCEGVNPFLLLANVGCNILIQTTASAHINYGIDAEKQMAQHIKFIKSKTRKLICKNAELERLEKSNHDVDL